MSKDVSEDTRDILRLRDSAVRTIYNPVLRQELVQRAREPVTHPWFEEPRPSPVLISVGRLSRMKDFATLLRAFAAVKEKLPCRLVILGEGDERTNLDTLAVELGVEDDVWMPGFELNPYRFVSRADLFVMSSRGEGMPNALLEAVALRVPAVSTDCLAGPREVLDDGRLGELVPVGDHAALSAAILRVVRDKEVTLATDEDLQPYTIEACSSSYLKMFEEFSSA